MAILPRIQERRRVLVSIFKLPGVFDLKRIRWCPQRVETKGLIVVATNIAAHVVVIVIAFLLIPFCYGQFDREIIRHAEVEDTVSVVGVVLLVANAQLATELTRWPRAGNVDRTANRIAPEQGALRTTEYLHALEINAAQQTARIGTNKHVIDHDCHGRIEVLLNIGHANAADKNRRNAARALSGIVDHDVGRYIRQICDVARKLTFNFALSKRTHGKTDVLQVFRSFPRGDDHFLQHPTLRKHRRNGQSCRCRQHRNTQ